LGGESVLSELEGNSKLKKALLRAKWVNYSKVQPLIQDSVYSFSLRLIKFWYYLKIVLRFSPSSRNKSLQCYWSTCRTCLDQGIDLKINILVSRLVV
jgi:hypothetical protein